MFFMVVKLAFQVANLLLATVNFEPWDASVHCKTKLCIVGHLLCYRYLNFRSFQSTQQYDFQPHDAS